MSKQPITKSLEPIVFRDEAELRNKNIRLNDVLDICLYLTDKLDGANSVVHGHEILVGEGARLVAEVFDVHSNESRYSNRLKADIADYVARAMTYFIKVEEVNHSRVENHNIAETIFTDNFGKQLKNKATRDTFSYTAQLVDALLELAVRTGAINRDNTHAWRELKQHYLKQPKDEVIIKAYNPLVCMKEMIRARYSYLHQLASSGR